MEFKNSEEAIKLAHAMGIKYMKEIDKVDDDVLLATMVNLSTMWGQQAVKFVDDKFSLCSYINNRLLECAVVDETKDVEVTEEDFKKIVESSDNVDSICNGVLNMIDSLDGDDTYKSKMFQLVQGALFYRALEMASNKKQLIEAYEGFIKNVKEEYYGKV